MNCPNCAQEVMPDSLLCYHCNYDVVAAQEAYGFETLRVERITEIIHSERGTCLGAFQRFLLNHTLDRLERQFPEVHFAICIFEVNAPVSLSQYGFWLLNHGSFPGADRPEANSRAALLLLDLRSATAGFALGYVVERFLREPDLVMSLRAGQEALRHGNFGAGANAILKQFGACLARRVKEAARDPHALEVPRPSAPPRTPTPVAPSYPEPRNDRGPIRRPIRDLEPNQI